MKVSKIFFVVIALAIILFSGCELIGDTVGGGVGDITDGGSGGSGSADVDYVFDTPLWIRGTWVNAADSDDWWTFTATTVTWSNAGSPVIMGEANTTWAAISGESQTPPDKYEFIYSVIFPHIFVHNGGTSLTLNGSGPYNKTP